MKVVQATHRQGDISNGMLRGMQCSCMSLMSVCWTLFKSVSIWDSFDLDCILQKEIFCLNLSIITAILGWKTYHISVLLKIHQ